VAHSGALLAVVCAGAFAAQGTVASAGYPAIAFGRLLLEDCGGGVGAGAPGGAGAGVGYLDDGCDYDGEGGGGKDDGHDDDHDDHDDDDDDDDGDGASVSSAVAGGGGGSVRGRRLAAERSRLAAARAVRRRAERRTREGGGALAAQRAVGTLLAYALLLALLKGLLLLPVFCLTTPEGDAGAPPVLSWQPHCPEQQQSWVGVYPNAAKWGVIDATYFAKQDSGDTASSRLFLNGVQRAANGSSTAGGGAGGGGAVFGGEHAFALENPFLYRTKWDALVVLAALLFRRLLQRTGRWQRRRAGAAGGGARAALAALLDLQVRREWRGFHARLAPPAAAALAHAGAVRRGRRAAAGALAAHSAADEAKPGACCYTATIVLQVLTLLYIVFFFGAMSAVQSDTDGGTSIAQQLSDNSFSSAMVGAVFVQLAGLILERVAMKLRSASLKLALQLLTVLVVHWACCIGVPTLSQTPTYDNGALVTFYLLQCAYMALGAKQLRDGYPVWSQGPGGSLTSRGDGPLQWYVFQAYMAAPFAFEMRALLDWVTTPTSLDLPMWMRVDEVYARLFLVKCNMRYRRDNHFVLQGHKAQPWTGKLGGGFGRFAVLVAILVGPMYLFSSGAAGQVANPVTGVTISVRLYDQTDRRFNLYEATVRTLVTLTDEATGTAALPAALQTREPKAALAKYGDAALVQLAGFRAPAGSKWGISPPWSDGLADSLARYKGDGDGKEGGGGMRWTVDASFSRALPDTAKTVQLTQRSWAVTEEERWLLLQALSPGGLRPRNATTAAQEAEAAVHGAGAGADAVLDGVLRKIQRRSGFAPGGRAAGGGGGGVSTGGSGGGGSGYLEASPVPVREAFFPVLYVRSDASAVHWKLNGPSDARPPDFAAEPIDLTLQALPDAHAAPAGAGAGAGGSANNATALPSLLWWRASLPAGGAEEKESIHELCRARYADSSATGEEGDGDIGVCLVLISQGVVTSLALLGLASYSVTTLYSFIVVTIGALVKGALRGNADNIIYSELPSPQELIDLCEGIFVTRSQRYAGHLKDEVRLYETLVKLLRSPEMLLRIAGTDSIHLLPEKKDAKKKAKAD
jgi:hypothetical protein